MIGPETRGAIPIIFALDTASSVRGYRSLKSHAFRLNNTAKPIMIKLRIRTKKRLNFPAAVLRLDSAERLVFASGFGFMCYLAKNQNHTEMLKISIRLTFRRKPRKPESLISMR